MFLSWMFKDQERKHETEHSITAVIVYFTELVYYKLEISDGSNFNRSLSLSDECVLLLLMLYFYHLDGTN